MARLAYVAVIFLGLSQLALASVVFNQVREDWELGPFVKIDASNPVLLPRNDTFWYCPVRKESIAWEAKDVFNPAAITRNGEIYMIYRAEDFEGQYLGTSRIGLAKSRDGVNFHRLPVPIFYPDNDDANVWEWEGGCEDPRIATDGQGLYVLTYTAYNGTIARLMVASTRDFFVWQKHGPIFRNAYGGILNDVWSKSGSIVTEMDPETGDFNAVKVNGKYWMYWGDLDIYAATSDDLVDWTPIMNDDLETPKPVFSPRPGKFDSHLVEPGPQAILRDDGILLIYNSRNIGGEDVGGDPELPEGTYAAGQILMSTEDPTQVVARTESYFMKPDKDYEIIGQVNNVVFLEGLVYYKGQYFIYYGTADSKIAVAATPLAK